MAYDQEATLLANASPAALYVDLIYGAEVAASAAVHLDPQFRRPTQMDDLWVGAGREDWSGVEGLLTALVGHYARYDEDGEFDEDDAGDDDDQDHEDEEVDDYGDDDARAERGELLGMAAGVITVCSDRSTTVRERAQQASALVIDLFVHADGLAKGWETMRELELARVQYQPVPGSLEEAALHRHIAVLTALSDTPPATALETARRLAGEGGAQLGAVVSDLERRGVL
jgi:hypothetical protein